MPPPHAVQPAYASPAAHTARKPLRLAIFDPARVAPDLVRRLFAAPRECVCEYVELPDDAPAPNLDRFDAAVVMDPSASPQQSAGQMAARTNAIRELLDQAQCPALVLTDRPASFESDDALATAASPECSIDGALGILRGLVAARMSLHRLRDEHRRMRLVSESVNTYFEAMDQELRLASRLQKEFLPVGERRIGPLRFTTVFRPCSWVSGDIFDILPLDDTHTGFYLADAVGHGVAAGLLTMYIKHAIRPKLLFREGHQIAPPDDVLAHLNEQLTAQELPDAQFITGWYGVVDRQTMTLDYAVAGHPPPLQISANGAIRELHGDGAILGLSRSVTYERCSVALRPGDRILVYSDGLEGVLLSERRPMPELPVFAHGMEQLFREPTPIMLARIAEALDNAPGSLNRADDVSMVVLDVGPA